ncbi:MAG: hypothetical protein QOH91_3169 [Mycobacterium sp.]|jgi:hypothetical protein|nr:hypothetical protein [Mycobacterium sp.]
MPSVQKEGVMPGFVNRFKAAAAEVERARQAEFERLVAVPPAADLAADLMPAFGPHGAKRGKPLTKDDIAGWMIRDYRLGFRERALCLTKLSGPIAEALQVLAHAELVYVTTHSEAPDNWRATSLGLASLANGTYRQRISERTDAAPAVAADPPGRQSTAERLQELQTLRAANVISEGEYSAKRAQIINDL